MVYILLIYIQDLQGRIDEFERLYAREIAQQYFFSARFLAAWVTLALINAALAQGKNRGGLAWFLVSLALGPIATLLICLREKTAGK